MHGRACGMMPRMYRATCQALVLAAVLVLGAATAQAASDSGSAARQAAAMTGGRVLDVQTGSDGSRTVYFVRVLLEDGRVKVVRIDGPAAGPGSR